MRIEDTLVLGRSKADAGYDVIVYVGPDSNRAQEELELAVDSGQVHSGDIFKRPELWQSQGKISSTGSVSATRNPKTAPAKK
ncbi:MAG: hypothetical protein AAF571_07085 [Verrucomicrobiota bacterium]